jgi:hypothetical protein
MAGKRQSSRAVVMLQVVQQAVQRRLLSPRRKHRTSLHMLASNTQQKSEDTGMRACMASQPMRAQVRAAAEFNGGTFQSISPTSSSRPPCENGMKDDGARVMVPTGSADIADILLTQDGTRPNALPRPPTEEARREKGFISLAVEPTRVNALPAEGNRANALLRAPATCMLVSPVELARANPLAGACSLSTHLDRGTVVFAQLREPEIVQFVHNCQNIASGRKI